MGQKRFGLEIILSKKEFVGNVFWVKKNLGRRKILAPKTFGSEIFSGKKKILTEILWVKKNWIGNFFG